MPHPEKRCVLCGALRPKREIPNTLCRECREGIARKKRFALAQANVARLQAIPTRTEAGEFDCFLDTDLSNLPKVKPANCGVCGSRVYGRAACTRCHGRRQTPPAE